MIPTNFRPYTPAEVIEFFFDKIKPSNMPALVEYLENPEKAPEIEGFKEDNKKLYFKIGGYWARAGEPFNPAPQPDDILQNTRELTQKELVDKLEYCGLRVFALKNMVIYLKGIPFEKFKKRRCWRFNRWGTPVSGNVGMEHFPVRVVKRTSKFKKKSIETLEQEKTEWELVLKKLTEVQSQHFLSQQ